jgi:acylphosphatase
LKRVIIHVTGRVQGVFFRVYTRDFVRNLPKVTGYVKNLRDGRVEILAEGDEVSLRKLANWARHTGSPYSQIYKTEENWENITRPQYSEFLITH